MRLARGSENEASVVELILLDLSFEKCYYPSRRLNNINIILLKCCSILYEEYQSELFYSRFDIIFIYVSLSLNFRYFIFFFFYRFSRFHRISDNSRKGYTALFSIEIVF